MGGFIEEDMLEAGGESIEGPVTFSVNSHFSSLFKECSFSQNDLHIVVESAKTSHLAIFFVTVRVSQALEWFARNYCHSN